jgi:sugar lactone lactonase YvrE
MAALSAVVFGAFGMGASAANAATTYGPQKTLATNIQAAAVGVDSVGNVFVSETSIGNYYGDYTAQQIFEIPATGTNEYAKLWEGAQDLPAGEIAVDRSGNLYYADSVGLIQKVSPLQEVPTGADPYSPPVTVTIGNDPDFAAGGVAIDSAGNLFASDLNQGGAIWEVPASGPSKLIDGSAGAQSLAVDKAGDLFWTQANNGNQIWELPAGASPSQAARLASGYTFAAPQGVAVNSSGDVFVANSGAGNVVDLPASSGNPGTGTPSTLGNGFIQPVDIAVDSAGDVFVADLGNIGTGDGQVAEIPAIQTAPTTTTVTSSANPIYLGQPVTFTVNVKETSGSATPTGTVALVMGETTVGTATLDPTGTATITTSSLPPGYDEITAVYAGDSSNASSNSQMFPETVNAPTVASLISLTGQYVEGSAAFKKLPARSQAATIKLIDAATQYLTQYNPKLTAKQKAALVSGYDLAITVLQRSGYLTSDQVTTLKTIAANL